MAEFKEFSIRELFDIVYGNGELTKAHIHAHPGPHPVFGASADPSRTAGSIDSFDFDADALSFVRIGYAGHVALRQAPFSVTCNVLVLKPKSEWAKAIHLRYFVPVISAAFRVVATGRFKEDGRQDYTQINQAMALAATISVPVDADGRPDLPAQMLLADRYDRLAGIRSDLSRTAEDLSTLNFGLELRDVEVAEISLEEAFDVRKGVSTYTEKFALANVGSYPLYTAATRNVKPALINTFDHEVEALHYTTEGAHAGTVFHRPKHRFAISGHAGILTRKRADISYAYALREVSRVFAGEGFRWASNTPSKNKIRDLRLRFPVTADGAFDLVAQEAIATRMRKLDAQREATVDALQRLAKAEVIFDAVPA